MLLIPNIFSVVPCIYKYNMSLLNFPKYLHTLYNSLRDCLPSEYTIKHCTSHTSYVIVEAILYSTVALVAC